MTGQRTQKWTAQGYQDALRDVMDNWQAGGAVAALAWIADNAKSDEVRESATREKRTLRVKKGPSRRSTT